ARKDPPFPWPCRTRVRESFPGIEYVRVPDLVWRHSGKGRPSRDAALHRRVWRLVGTARVGRGIEHRVCVCVGRSGHVLDRPGWHRVGGEVMDFGGLTDQELADLIEGA